MADKLHFYFLLHTGMIVQFEHSIGRVCKLGVRYHYGFNSELPAGVIISGPVRSHNPRPSNRSHCLSCKFHILPAISLHFLQLFTVFGCVHRANFALDWLSKSLNLKILSQNSLKNTVYSIHKTTNSFQSKTKSLQNNRLWLVLFRRTFRVKLNKLI